MSPPLFGWLLTGCFALPLACRYGSSQAPPSASPIQPTLPAPSPDTAAARAPAKSSGAGPHFSADLDPPAARKYRAALLSEVAIEVKNLSVLSALGAVPRHLF